MEKVVILGAGESGSGAAILARKLGFDVFLTDSGLIKDIFKKDLENEGILYEESGHEMERVLSANLVIKSPGIPGNTPAVLAIIEKGIPVISEIEFAARYSKVKTIGITGSNGKTTTTMLTFHLMKQAGFKVEVGGNVGFSFARLVAAELDGNVPEWYVLELSSFQLDDIYTYRPDISMILNITPDHLDRYEYRMEKYIAAKFRITQSQLLSDFFIFNADNDNIRQYLIEHQVGSVSRLPVSLDLYKGGKLHFPQYETTFELVNANLRGAHNWFNAYCASMAALLAGAESKAVQEGLNTFQNVEHRLEFVAEVGGVEYINDSKATNVDSVYFALGAVNKPIVLILGGVDKGNDYRQIEGLVKEKVKAIVCMGKDNGPILSFFEHSGIPIIQTLSAVEAVAAASKLSVPGDVVMLSPACASFDLFANYEDRGKRFKQAVMDLG